MTRLPLVIYPDPRLHEKTALVSDFGSALHSVLDDMADTMYASRGIGLAGPQVGYMYRVAVIDLSEDKSERFEIINPQILKSDGSSISEEGCLSIPDYRDKIKRHSFVTVKAQDRNGQEFEVQGEGLLAYCLQHEIDHLDGILFIDRLSQLKRQLFKRSFQKREKSQE